MADLTPDEISFFETGELPESLIQAPSTPTTEPTPPAQVTPPTEPTSQNVETPAETTPQADPFTQMEQRMNALFTKKMEEFAAKIAESNKPAVAEIVVPDELTDPLGNMMHQLKQVNSAITNLETQTAAQRQQAEMQKQMSEFVSSVQAAKAEFIKTAPDFDAAYNHIRTIRAADLQALGASEAEVKQTLLQDEFRLSEAALQRGKNPAEEMYNMAKRYGYAPKAATPAAATVPPSQKMEQIKAGTAADHQLGKAGHEANLTLDGLKDLSNGDLNKLVLDDKMWHTIVGGTSSNDIF